MKIEKILPIVGIIIFIAILFTLDYSKIITIFLNINPIYTLLSFLTLVPLLILVNIEWQILLKKQKIRVSFLYSLKNLFIGYFYGFITPGAIGAFTRSLYLHEESKAPLPKCLSNIIIFNTVDYFALLLISSIGALYLSSISPYLFYLILLVIIIIFSLLLFFLKKEKSKNIFTKIVQSKIFSTIKDKLENSIDSFYEDLPRFRDVIIPFFISLIGWSAKYVIVFFISKLFFIDIPFIDFILILAVADAIASLPISIYGLGTREISLISMLSFYSVSYEQTVSFSLFIFVIFWLNPSIIGIFVTFFESNKLKEFSINGKNAEKFNNYMKRYPELYQNLANIVKKYLPKKIDKPIIVDLGVGSGLLSVEMKNIMPKAEIIGIDSSSEMLLLAEKNSNIKTILGESNKIPLHENSVDLVVSRFSLTYWKNPKDSFKEISRVLKPGGILVLEALNKDFSKLKLLFIKWHMILKGSSTEIARYHFDAYKTAYSIGPIKNFLKKMNFKICYTEDKVNNWKFIIIAEKR